jgi:23S rRNA (guanosine2251-2'-O)-methyltransferase
VADRGGRRRPGPRPGGGGGRGGGGRGGPPGGGGGKPWRDERPRDERPRPRDDADRPRGEGPPERGRGFGFRGDESRPPGGRPPFHGRGSFGPGPGRGRPGGEWRDRPPDRGEWRPNRPPPGDDRGDRPRRPYGGDDDAPRPFRPRFDRDASGPPGRPNDRGWSRPPDRDAPRGPGPRRFNDAGPRGDGPPWRPPRPRPFADRHGNAGGGRPPFGDRDRFPGPGRPAYDDRPARPPAVDESTADLVGADDEIVAGRRPVEEAFAARRDARRLLVVPQRREALERIVLHATNLRIPVVEVEGGTLTALAGFDGHQGVAIVVSPRAYASLDDILARAIERGEPPFVLALDSLEDPQNFGTLLRSAEAAGVHGVIFPTRRQAPLSPAAVKASAGAVEHLLLCPVDDLAGALADLHARGLRIAGAEAGAPMTAREADLRGPLAIVVGSEGQGLGPAVRRRCDLLVRIPLRGAIDSLNAAVAGSILLFEAVAQRDERGGGPPPPPAETSETSGAPENTEAPGPAKKRTRASKQATEPSPKPRTRKPKTTPDQASTNGAGAADDRVEGAEELLPGGLGGGGAD